MTVQTLKLVQHDSSHADFMSGTVTPTVPVTLICDSFLLRSGLEHILLNSPFAIANVVSLTSSERVRYCALSTGLVIIEATRNATPVLDVIRQVSERSPETRVVVLADQFDLAFVQMGHEAGVNGFCLADSSSAVLVKSLELVMLGENALPSKMLRSIMGVTPQRREPLLQDNTVKSKLPDLRGCKLSVREAEVLTYLREGAPNKLIARKFDVAEATVKVHVKAILRKIGVANRTQAAMWASQHLPRQSEASMNV